MMESTGKAFVSHKRHSDFESFDKITLEVVPRYKESELSGDEWRQHVRIQFWFKGHVVHEAGYSRMRDALMLLGSEWLKAQEPIPMSVIEIENDACDQPSCGNPPTHRYWLKELFANDGAKLDQSTVHGRDCRLEDSDGYYIKEAI